MDLTMHLTVKILLFLSGVQILKADKCFSRQYDEDSVVCVCNENYCDTVPTLEKPENRQFVTYTTNRAGLRMEKEIGIFDSSNETTSNKIIIGTEEYQEILGFGGAFSDSTGINIKSLKESVGELLMRSYFSEDGIGYTIGRIPIGGTDFSLREYTYCDSDTPDPDLNNFALQPEDYEYKIPFIQQAMSLTNQQLKLFASAWCAPRWMWLSLPVNTSMIKFEYYDAWAQYAIKFLDEYRKNNITLWGLTTGNEPEFALLPSLDINMVAWIPTLQQKWIKESLGPALRNSSHSDIKLMILDDLKTHLRDAVEHTLNDPDVKSYIDGIAIHWYYDKYIKPEETTLIHNLLPDKFILGTEACTGLMDKVALGSWSRGEEYAQDIIEDLNNWYVGWTDWNMALNLEGGPTYISNFLDSPIIVNATAGEFYKQPMFYTLGHFSKFIPRGSVRINSSSFDSNVLVTAFKRPDEGTVVTILNKNEIAIKATIVTAKEDEISIPLTEKSLTSLIYWD